MMLNLPNLESAFNGKTQEQILDALHKYRKELNFLLMNLDESNMPSIAGRLDGLDGSFSLIDQQLDSITLAVGNAQGDISALQITAGEIQTAVTNLDGDFSTLSQTVGNISTTVYDANAGLGAAWSAISQNASDITLKVSASYVNNAVDDLDDYLTGAEIALRVNQAGSSVKIQADHIDLLGITRIYDPLNTTRYIEFSGNEMRLNGTGDQTIIFSGSASLTNRDNSESLEISAFGDLYFYTAASFDISDVGNIVWGSHTAPAHYS